MILILIQSYVKPEKCMVNHYANEQMYTCTVDPTYLELGYLELRLPRTNSDGPDLLARRRVYRIYIYAIMGLRLLIRQGSQINYLGNNQVDRKKCLRGRENKKPYKNILLCATNVSEYNIYPFW